jgi:hypothetical protein
MEEHDGLWFVDTKSKAITQIFRMFYVIVSAEGMF